MIYYLWSIPFAFIIFTIIFIVRGSKQELIKQFINETEMSTKKKFFILISALVVDSIIWPMSILYMLYMFSMYPIIRRV